MDTHLELIKTIKQNEEWTKASWLADRYDLTRKTAMYLLDHHVDMKRLFARLVKLPKGERRTAKNTDKEYKISNEGIKWVEEKERG